MITINTKLRLSVSILLVTMFFSYWVYWKNITTLHDTSFEAFGVADYMHTTESFHSSIHAMLIAASNYLNSDGNPVFLKNYEAHSVDARKSLNELKNVTINSMSDQSSKPLIESIEGKVLTFQATLEDVFQEDKEVATKKVKKAQKLFDTIFHDNYLPLHKKHQMHNSTLQENAHTIWENMTILFLVQLAFVIIVGGLVVIYIDRFVLKVYSLTEQMTIRDPLTGLYNRRHLEQVLVAEHSRAKRYNKSFAVIMADLDDFKKFNDTYGHQNGDKLLKDVAGLFLLETRKSDKVFRYGGEEFLVFLPESTMDSACMLAEKLRAVIEGHFFTLRNKF